MAPATNPPRPGAPLDARGRNGSPDRFGSARLLPTAASHSRPSTDAPTTSIGPGLRRAPLRLAGQSRDERGHTRQVIVAEGIMRWTQRRQHRHFDRILSASVSRFAGGSGGWDGWGARDAWRMPGPRSGTSAAELSGWRTVPTRNSFTTTSTRPIEPPRRRLRWSTGPGKCPTQPDRLSRLDHPSWPGGRQRGHCPRRGSSRADRPGRRSRA